jgi:enoyl-CoA hydratase
VVTAPQSPVLILRTEGVATVTLNRPAVRNALNSELISQLRIAMAELEADDEVRAVVLTGADPAFCAGIDLKAVSAGERLLDTDLDSAAPVWFPWTPMTKPVIGAINGAAITGGFELALNCDFLIASERAAFADTHARLGLLPGWGLSVLLPQRVGFAMARRMSYTGDFIDAEVALRAGLVTEVVPHDDLLPRSEGLASTVASNNRGAVAAWLALYRRIEAEVIGRGLEIEQRGNRDWRAEGGNDDVVEQIPGVIARGRSQTRG